jgi:hypothetical protein
MQSLISNAFLTMSSLEIADLVESRHDTVRLSIERLAEREVIQRPPVAEVKNNQGQATKVYHLGKRDSYVVVAQLSPEFTGRLVDRWQELETKETLPPSFTPALTLRQQSADILRCELEVFSLLACPLHLAQAEAVKAVRRETGVDYAHALALAPAQNNIQAEEVMLEPTELARALGVRSAIVMNVKLGNWGWQVKTAAGWEPTEAGAPFCQKHHWNKNNKEGYNWKWNLEAAKFRLNEDALA